jgi:antirestriction protein ArdC
MPDGELTKRDVYQEITNRIIAAIESGAGTYRMPWHSSGAARTRPENALTKKRYRGVNVLALWTAGEARDYRSGYWGTYKQWGLLGAHVRKGERGSLVVFYKEMEREVGDPATEEVAGRTFLFARSSWVFNADQVDGWLLPDAELVSHVETISNVERFVAHTKADVRHGGQRAFYRHSDDFIQIPEKNRFIGTDTSSPTETYYSVLCHELTHWSGHQRRLDRNLTGRFGEEGYAMEELVAELGAAFLSADLRITNSPRQDHAAYIASWLRVLKNDKKAIFTAASKAHQAADYLSGLQPQTSPNDGTPSGPEELAHAHAGAAD